MANQQSTVVESKLVENAMTLTFMLGKGGNAFGIQIHSLISLNITV